MQIHKTHTCAKSLQSYPTLCNAMDCSLTDNMGFSRQEYWSGLPCGSSRPREWTCISYISGGVFTTELINFYCCFLFQNKPWFPCFTSHMFFLFIISSKNDKKIIDNLYHKIYISLYFFHIAIWNVSIFFHLFLLVGG